MSVVNSKLNLNNAVLLPKYTLFCGPLTVWKAIDVVCKQDGDGLIKLSDWSPRDSLKWWLEIRLCDSMQQSEAPFLLNYFHFAEFFNLLSLKWSFTTCRSLLFHWTENAVKHQTKLEQICTRSTVVKTELNWYHWKRNKKTTHWYFHSAQH